MKFKQLSYYNAKNEYAIICMYLMIIIKGIIKSSKIYKSR